MNHLLDEGRIRPLPTAVFCASDAIASGCLESLAAHGLRAPEDVSIAGFDDMLLARMTTPPLTTVRQPLRRMGQFAVERLQFRINESVEMASALRSTGDEQPERSALTDREPINGALHLLSPPSIAPAHTEIFPVELVIRSSVRPPPERPSTTPT